MPDISLARKSARGLAASMANCGIVELNRFSSRSTLGYSGIGCENEEGTGADQAFPRLPQNVRAHPRGPVCRSTSMPITCRRN